MTNISRSVGKFFLILLATACSTTSFHFAKGDAGEEIVIEDDAAEPDAQADETGDAGSRAGSGGSSMEAGTSGTGGTSTAGTSAVEAGNSGTGGTPAGGTGGTGGTVSSCNAVQCAACPGSSQTCCTVANTCGCTSLIGCVTP